jgi:hypothetical protein
MAGNAPNVAAVVNAVPLPAFPRNLVLANGINASRLRMYHTLISATQIETESNGKDTQDNFILAVLMAIRVATKKANVWSAPTRSAAGNANYQNNRPNQSAKTYDRLLTFAYVTDPGKCFALLMQTKAASVEFFKHGRNQGFGVGDTFLIGGPYHSVNRLGTATAMALLDTFSGQVFPLENGVQYLPRFVLEAPVTAGSTKYFCYHGIQLDLPANIKPVQSICSGRLCDRQIRPNNLLQFNCGCMNPDSKGIGHILNMNVTIPCEPGFDVGLKTTVLHYRSLKTTNVFADDRALRSVQTDSHTHLTRLKSRIQTVLNYINHHGGWTLVGWIRTGETADASDAGNTENLASISSSPHLTYMMPTNRIILDSPAYKLLRFTEESVHHGPSDADSDVSSDEDV